MIGVGDHFSMLLADKVQPWDGLLDAVAELAAVQHVLSGVGVVLRPSASTGPQCPEWGESRRFARVVLDIAVKAGEDRDLGRPAPASLDEVEVSDPDPVAPSPPAKKKAAVAGKKKAAKKQQKKEAPATRARRR